MEALLAVAVLIGTIFVAISLTRSKSSSGRVAAKPSSRSTAPRRPSSNVATPSPSRFDASSSRALHHKRVLAGPAYVTDGDTIKIKGTQVRLFGIDAPELDHPYGKKAKWALHRLCKDQVVRAEIIEEDDHGRTVAHCYLPDGRDLSAEMVKLGLAIDWPKFSGGKYGTLETPDARVRLFLADARQKGRMHVWEKFEARQNER